MSGSAVAQQTWIDGKLYYSIESDAAEIERINAARERLIAKALVASLKPGGKDDGENEKDEVTEEKKKPGLRFLLPNSAGNECRSIFNQLYHNGRRLHTCSRNGCCNN